MAPDTAIFCCETKDRNVRSLKEVLMKKKYPNRSTEKLREHGWMRVAELASKQSNM